MVNLTNDEARLLYEHLRNLWAPRSPYADYMRVIHKLENETKHPTLEKVNAPSKP